MITAQGAWTLLQFDPCVFCMEYQSYIGFLICSYGVRDEVVTDHFHFSLSQDENSTDEVNVTYSLAVRTKNNIHLKTYKMTYRIVKLSFFLSSFLQNKHIKKAASKRSCYWCKDIYILSIYYNWDTHLPKNVQEPNRKQKPKTKPNKPKPKPKQFMLADNIIQD